VTETLESGPIRVLIVDDHPLLREGVVGAADGIEALHRVRALRPDVTLMDLRMPGMDGVEVIAAIRAEFPQARILVLTTDAGDAHALRALKAGASGYVLKNSARKELLGAIRKVHEGGSHLPAELATEIALNAVHEQLSAREIEVLKLASSGNGNKQIAWKLTISEDTVKTHFKSIFTKLGVTDRTHAVAIAARRGIIEL
jgi:DNA-binding NarL/FixJ family response regulator